MCIIIDTCVAALALQTPADKDYHPVSNWLFSPRRNGLLVVGGLLTRELAGNQSIAASLTVLKRAGRVHILEDAPVDQLTGTLAASGQLKSNDPHVIALAQLSGTRVLCTSDNNLISDFTSATLIHKPRGKVYKGHKHRALLTHVRTCPYSKVNAATLEKSKAGGRKKRKQVKKGRKK